jgi:hypothetical protein
LDDFYGGYYTVHGVCYGLGRGLKTKGDTGMYEIDFISVAFGYICGIVLYASVSNIMYMEENDENQ